MPRLNATGKLGVVALLLAAAYVPVVRGNLLAKVPGFYCESFGCGALGVIYLLFGFAIPVIVASGAALLPGDRRWLRFVQAFLVSLFFMLCAGAVIYCLNRYEISRSYESSAKACAEYPQLCPTPSLSDQ